MLYTYNAYLEFRSRNCGDLSKKPWWPSAVYVKNNFFEFQHLTRTNYWGNFHNLPANLRALSRFDNRSRIYISAHCNEKSEYVYDDSEGSISYVVLAKKLSGLLTHPSLKNNHEPFLKISLISCLAAVGSKEKQHQDSFAALLQKELCLKHGIYVEIVARNAKVRLSYDSAKKYTNDEFKNDEYFKWKNNLRLKKQELIEVNKKIAEYRRKPLNLRTQDFLRFLDPLVECRLKSSKIKEEINVISDKLYEFILHHQPGSKVSYKWRSDWSRSRSDVYAENDTKIWRKKLERTLLSNVALLNSDLCLLAQRVHFGDIGYVVDELFTILYESNGVNPSFFEPLEDLYNEITQMPCYFDREPTVILPRVIP